MSNFKIYAPTYKRSKLCSTHEYCPEVIYVLKEDEEDDYRDVDAQKWIVPNEAQGNLSRIRNYILDHADTDHVILLDDDIKYFGKFDDQKPTKMTGDQFLDMVQEGCQLAEDLDVRFWGVNCIADKGSYREYTPFAMKAYIGGPFQAHYKNPCRYDEVIYLKEDYDMTLQVLNQFRRNLRLNRYHYVCEQATMAGGCATYRNMEREKEHNQMLQKKWGSKIVHFDTGKSQVNRKKEVTYDINPIIKVPIGGV